MSCTRGKNFLLQLTNKHKLSLMISKEIVINLIPKIFTKVPTAFVKQKKIFKIIQVYSVNTSDYFCL